MKEALDMVYEKLREQPAGCAAAFEADELEHFFKLCGDLARNNPGEEQKILNMARTMMGFRTVYPRQPLLPHRLSLRLLHRLTHPQNPLRDAISIH